MIEKFIRMDERIHAYQQAHQPPEHPILAELRSLTEALPEAKMQSTLEQGHFLSLLVGLLQARGVLEIGTFTGTSTLAMAMALPDGGRVITCDLDRASTELGRIYWNRAGVADKIDLRIGPAATTLDEIENAAGRDYFDLAFIDAERTGYGTYFETCLRPVRPGGLIVLDNTLRRGRVADPHDVEPDTEALRAFNRTIAGDERVDRVLIPVASGMTLARRR